MDSKPLQRSCQDNELLIAEINQEKMLQLGLEMGWAGSGFCAARNLAPRVWVWLGSAAQRSP